MTDRHSPLVAPGRSFLPPLPAVAPSREWKPSERKPSERKQCFRWRGRLLPLVLLSLLSTPPAGVSVISSPVQAAETVRQEVAAGPGQFVEGFDDLPLMDPLQPEPDSATVFDSPFGRMVESYASGQTTFAAVGQFYRETLPQLGWTVDPPQANKILFHREGEQLSLEVIQKGNAVTVRFQLSPSRQD